MKNETLTEYVEDDGRLVSQIDGWWEVVTKEKREDGTDETVVTRVNKHSTKVRPAPVEVGIEMFSRQAKPTIIRPTKRIKPTRDGSVEIFFGDTHHPFQDKAKLALAMLAVQELQPDTVTFLGDDVDNSLFSRFEQREEWMGSTQASLDQFHDTLATVKANAPGAEIIVFEGNHNLRLQRELRKYNGELLGLKRANAERELGVLSLQFLLRLDELGVEYIQGYPSAEHWHTDNLKSFHGARTASTGSVVSKELETETVNFVHGHTHKAELVFRQARVGRETLQIFGMSPGTLIDRNLAPSGTFATDGNGETVPQHHNWHTTLGVVFHDDGFVAPHLLPITDRIDIFGKTYKS